MDIQFIPEAQKEYKNLDGSLKKIVDDKFEDLEENPYLGEL